MSKFSVYLGELIEQSGESISKIAKGSGVERTSIHKALKDERTLPYHSLKQLIQYMQLTLSESRELHRYYEIYLHGEDIFAAQTSITDLLSDLSQLSFLSYKNLSFPDISFLPDDIPELICGKPQIEAAVKTILQQEIKNTKAEIDLYLPSECDLADSLLQLWKAEYNFKVNQIAAFLPNRSGSLTRAENLKLLRKILPLSILSRGNYLAYYYFEKNDNIGEINPMPYFIITPNYLLTFDGKLTVMQVQTSKPILKLYKKRFLNTVKDCSPLIYYYNVKSIVTDLINFLSSYKFTPSDKHDGCAMMTQPSLGIYCTDEIIEKNIRDDMPGRRLLVPVFQRHFSALRKSWTDITMIFTEEGLRDFAATGIVRDFPPKISKAFDAETRLWFIRSLYNDIKSDAIAGCIVDSDEITIPNYITLNCDKRNGLLIHAVQNFAKGSYACDIRIKEPSIINSFCSFMKSLPNSRFVYPKERTLAVFEELIEELENKNTAGKDM